MEERTDLTSLSNFHRVHPIDFRDLFLINVIMRVGVLGVFFFGGKKKKP